MSEKPLVSVVLTTFNRRQMAEQVLNSILNQTYSRFEVILVDDASSDGTEPFFQELKDDRLTYIRHTRNQGVQNASITGFEISRGDYLIFCGDDDIWSDPDRLKKQVAILEQDQDYRFGVTTCSVRLIGPDYSYTKTIQRPNNLVKHLLEGNGIIYGSAAMIRRQAYELSGGFDPDHIKGTDSDVFRRIVLLGYDVHFSAEVMVDYSEAAVGRMTVINERAVMRSISGESRKLSKYSEYYALYPGVKSNIYQKLGNLYASLNEFKPSKENSKLARLFLLKSLRINPFNFRSFYLFLRALH